MPRTLRSKRDRALLWYAADGRCQACGEPLPEDWHADHTVPWRLTHRTNLFEMQALCPSCNLKKGGTMPLPMHVPYAYDLTAYRPGQGEGHLVATDRVIHGESYTTLVEPCGYGKRDMLWMITLDLWAQGYICGALVINPNDTLRDQMVDPERFATLCTRYSITGPPLKFRALESKGGPPATYKAVLDWMANGEMLVSTNIQLVDNRLWLFEQWVEHKRHQTGKPPLIIIDEAQSESTANEWGNTVQALVQAGAQALLLTATPTRADGKPLVGFEVEDIRVEDIIHRKIREHEDPLKGVMDFHWGCDVTHRLKAHHTTPWKQAWNEGAIARISRTPFDVQCTLFTEAKDLGTLRLSQLSYAQIEEYLGKIVREPTVIREGVRLLVQKLEGKQRFHPQCAAMVFVGRDTDPVNATNAQARYIEKLIKAQHPSWRVIIATHSDGNVGKEDITRFTRERDPIGDVLIVKQMAGCGADAPRAKVLLDLSPVRAEGAWTQRVMRINRLYHGVVGVYIAPDDIISRYLFEAVVKDQGGEPQTYREVGEWIDSIEFDRKPPDERPAILVEHPDAADFNDSDDFHAEAAKRPLVDAFLQTFPEMAAYYSEARVAVQGAGWSPPMTLGLGQGSTRTDTAEGDLQDSIVKQAKEITSQRLSLGTRAYDQAAYQRMIQSVYADAYRRSGMPPETQLHTVHDLALLTQIKKHLILMNRAEGRRYDTH
jgi:superfamily II DNA or RNA helicase